MDTGYVLTWVVTLSSGLSVALTIRRGGRPRGWLVVHGGLLALLAIIGALAGISYAGLCTGLVWVPAVLLPTLLARRLPRLLADRRFEAASRVARLLSLLHPADGWQFQPIAVEVLHALDRGELDRAAALLERLPPPLSLRRTLHAHWWRASGRFIEARAWLEELRAHDVPSEPSLLALEMRVAGELGDFPALLRAAERARSAAGHSPDRASTALLLAGFTGKRSLTERILDRALPELPADAKAFWRLTAAQRAGEAAPDSRTLLANTDHPITRAAVLRREATPLLPITEAERTLCGPMLADIAREVETGALTPPSRARPWASWAIASVLLIAFLFELPGGPESLPNLAEMGALVLPTSLTPGEWWRVITGGLLHYGWLHLTLNAVAILFFGARLERRTSTFTLIAIFVLSNVGAMQIAVWTTEASEALPGILIGASGGVMGVLGGVLAGVMVRFMRHRLPQERRELSVLLAIVLLQAVFDAATPEVSGPVHLYGLGIGFALSLTRLSLLSLAKDDADR